MKRVRQRRYKERRQYTYLEESKTLKQWAIDKEMNYTTLYRRIFNLEWSLEKALTTPVNTPVRKVS